MTAHRSPSVRVGDVVRWWPLVLVPVVIAVSAAIWSVHHRTPTYTAATRLMVIPLAQWDETFLATDLIRDAGDPKSTATTVAAQLDTPQEAAVAAAFLGGGATAASVDAAVKVAVVPDSNIVEIQAHSVDPRRAEAMSEGFAKAVLADRWRTISGQLDARIGAMAATTAADPNSGQASARLQTLTVIRQGGVDPTLQIDASTAAVADPRLPVLTVIGLAAAGGLFVGVLCAFAVARLRRRAPVDAVPARSTSVDPSRATDALAAYSPNGGG